jgi:hypothetical protein
MITRSSAERTCAAYATVIVDKNRYPVPTRYTGLRVRVHLSVTQVEIFHDGKKLARHLRLFGNNIISCSLTRPLSGPDSAKAGGLSWRPAAPPLAGDWPPCLEKLLGRFQESQGATASIKDFVTVLQLYQDYPGQEIKAAVELALAHQLSSSQGVKHLLLKTDPDPVFAPLPQWPATLIPDLFLYSQLGALP